MGSMPMLSVEEQGGSRGGTASHRASPPSRLLPRPLELCAARVEPGSSLLPRRHARGRPEARRQGARILARLSVLTGGRGSRSKGLPRRTTWGGRESRGVCLKEARRRVVASVGAAPPGELAPCGCRREEARRFFSIRSG
jgi:hypothetical protein